jgi:excisionase family DNA binding protein
VAVLSAPAVVITARDARWLAGVLEDLLERGYFAGHDAVRDRAVEVFNELNFVANGGQRLDELYSVRDAAAMLKCSTSTVRRRLEDGTLERVNVGRMVRVRLAMEAS